MKFYIVNTFKQTKYDTTNTFELEMGSHVPSDETIESATKTEIVKYKELTAEQYYTLKTLPNMDLNTAWVMVILENERLSREVCA